MTTCIIRIYALGKISPCFAARAGNGVRKVKVRSAPIRILGIGPPGKEITLVVTISSD